MKRKAKSGKKEPASALQKETSARQEEGLFPIVGIGASAGGLEALEQFLAHVPAESGMAFVIIQHLDPTHKGIMPELLQRGTRMPVIQAQDRLKVEPGHVYVIPPNKDMSILHGHLHLFNPGAPRGLRLPIDFFFRSLADDRQDRSVGVILSGMGSDGTVGLRAIKEKAGLALVQAPESAKFDSMPRSAIDAGLADVVAPAEELPVKIASYFAHSFVVRPALSLEPKAQSALEKIIILLRARSGHDFSLYKKNTVYRRIERRMGIHQIDKIAQYVRFLQDNPVELEMLFKELLIGVTSFFRDPDMWKELKQKALPPLLAAKKSGDALRAWVIGCSTGEEAYSLAMILREVLDEAKLGGRFQLQIFATDLDREAIDKARQGIYPDNIVADVTPERLTRFFVKEEHGYRVGKEIREMVVFAQQNVIMDPPFTKLDLLTCRNLLIYMSPELQKKLLPLFHYSLNPGGILFLGNAETVGSFTDLYTSVDGKSRLYRRLDSAVRIEPVEFPSTLASRMQAANGQLPKAAVNLQTLADQLVLQRFSPSAVLTNTKGDIIYISGRTGNYLEPAAGKANWNIFAMAREGLRYELAIAFRKAVGQKKEVVLPGLEVRTNGDTQSVDLLVQAIDKPDELQGMVITVFSDSQLRADIKPASTKGGFPVRGARTMAMEKELQEVREELQVTREEMHTSQEELKSANEELQSTNEELQSTNEELTTSKEELQSVNEELQTVNAELQSKVDELTRAQNDWSNLLNSTDIATLFLDKELRVRRFTTQATQIIKLIPGDVDRPITDLASDLDYPEMADDAKSVLQTLVPTQKEISTRDGRWYATRIMPYRTLQDRIDGVVITFTDITPSKKMEVQLREALRQQGGKKGEKGKKK